MIGWGDGSWSGPFLVRPCRIDFLADSSEQQVREAFIEGFDFLSKQKQRTTFDYEEAIGQVARILLGTNGTEAFDGWRAGQRAFKTNPSGPVEELPDNRKLLGAVRNLVSAGIVVPRLKREGGHCVFLRLTLSEKGERVVSKADEHPLHPGFLERFRAAAPTATDPVVAHLEDAVTCLEAGVLRPALMMVGVANEMTVRVTHDALAHQTKVTKAGPMAKMRDLLGDIDAVAGAWKGGGGSKDEQHRLKVAVGAAETVLGGEPTFPKSRLAVRHLGGMLLRGASKDDVLEDYPYLKLLVPRDLITCSAVTRSPVPRDLIGAERRSSGSERSDVLGLWLSTAPDSLSSSPSLFFLTVPLARSCGSGG